MPDATPLLPALDSLNLETLVSVLDALPVCALVIEEGNIHCNRATEQLTGYGRQEISSPGDFFTALFGAGAERARGVFDADREAGRTAARDFSITCKDGRAGVVSLTCSVSSKRLLCTLQDLTEARRLERELLVVSDKYRLITDAAMDAFLLADDSGRIVQVNDQCLSTYGYSSLDLLAMSVGDLESDETRAQTGAHLRDAVRLGRVRFESVHRVRDGRTIDVEASATYLAEERLFMVFVRDVSVSRISGRKLLESEALLRAIIDSVPFDFFALDLSGRYTTLSTTSIDTWGNAIGKTVQELAAGTCFERYVPVWLESNRRALAGETIQRERLYDWQGRDQYVQEIIGPVRDSQQRILGSFGININITQQKLIQKALSESEERYRHLSGLTSDYFHCCTRSGAAPFRVQWLGGAIEEITGYSEAEIFDEGCWLDHVHPEDRERVAAGKMKLGPGQSFTDEFRLVCKDGETCWIRESCRCEAGAAEGELLLFSASQNITAGKEAEMALQNVEEIFRLFLEHNPAYLVFKDENHKVLRLSRNYETLLGAPLSEQIGKSVRELYPPELAEQIIRDDLTVLREGRPSETQEELLGRIYSCLKFSIPQSGKSPLLVCIKTDVTAQKEAENALCRLNDKLDRRVAERTAQLEAAILEQESFSYSVSHDLRAPLRHINSFSAILLETYPDTLPEEARDYLSRICRATRRMGQLIDNLLELSRVSRTLINCTSVNLSELAERTALMLKETEPDRAVELVIQPDLHAGCDKILVRQLFENLLGNAWKYTSRVPAARIEFGAIASQQGAVFFVKDNGAGFDMAYKDKLFIPFQRLHGSEFEGNGIGLATAKRIVQRHGGSIWAEGEEDRGALFCFTLS